MTVRPRRTLTASSAANERRVKPARRPQPPATTFPAGLTRRSSAATTGAHHSERAKLSQNLDARHNKAIGAVKHSMICAIWHMLKTGEIYTDLGPDHLARRNPERQTKRLLAQLERLGHSVTIQEAAA